MQPALLSHLSKEAANLNQKRMTGHNFELEEEHIQMMDYSHFADIELEGKESASAELENYLNKMYYNA